MKKLGCSNRAIARYLHCAPSTISNELKRGTPPRTGSRGRAPGYSAKRGDAVYKENRKNSHKPHRIDKCTSFVQWVVTQVRTEKWSIDACVGYARKNKLFPEDEMVCTKTLYNEVWAGNLSLNILKLPEAIKRKKQGFYLYAQPFYHTCLTNGVQFKDGGSVFATFTYLYLRWRYIKGVTPSKRLNRAIKLLLSI